MNYRDALDRLINVSVKFVDRDADEFEQCIEDLKGQLAEDPDFKAEVREAFDLVVKGELDSDDLKRIVQEDFFRYVRDAEEARMFLQKVGMALFP